MKRPQGLALLMGAAILGITGFQVYWLKDNYTREKKALLLKTQAAFRETLLELQVEKLKLDNIYQINDSTSQRIKVFMNDDFKKEVKVTYHPKKEIISTINVIREKLRDSVKIHTETPSRILISMDKDSNLPATNSIKPRSPLPPPGLKGGGIFNLLYGVDSLQDSLRLKEIDSLYQIKLKEEKISIPYTISRKTSDIDNMEDGFNSFTIGLANPVTFTVEAGNTFPYLVRKISLPILFSIILIGITVLSFVLLYRNMLKQRRLAALKNEFISNITHELKTPIATVGVAIEALKNFNAIEDPRRTREYLDISSNELQRLGFLVDKVLKLSMFEKKEVELQYEPVNMRELVDEVVESLKLQFEKYHAKVGVSQDGEVSLMGDRLHLLSVIFNLLDNAIKYSKEEPLIWITLVEKENTVEITVKDNGIGIAVPYREKVFEKFFRVPQGNLHNAKGYGLGLSYVAEVVRKHKGSIKVDSELEVGTSFIVSLPKNSI